MTSSSEHAQVRAEVESVLRNDGIGVASDEPPSRVPDDARLRELALRIIQGDMDLEKISALTPEMTAELSAIIENLIALSTSTSIQQLELLNPYYSAFRPKVVRDRAKKAGDSR